MLLHTSLLRDTCVQYIEPVYNMKTAGEGAELHMSFAACTNAHLRSVKTYHTRHMTQCT